MTDTRNTRWYLDIMSPNTKGEKFAWLDPTSIYINGGAFTQLLDDLTADRARDTDRRGIPADPQGRQTMR